MRFKSLEGSGLEEKQEEKKGKAKKKQKELTVRYTEEGKQIPVGNGGVAATHTWTQTLKELTAIFEVP